MAGPFTGLAVLLLGCGRNPAPSVRPRIDPYPHPVSEAGFVRQVDAPAAFDSTGAPMAFPFLGGLNNPRPQLVDIDGDGDLDLFVQEYTGRMMLFERTGAGDSARYAFRSDDYQDLDIGEWSRFVDMDGDGDLDLLAESPYSYIRYFRNDGSSRQPRFVLAADTIRDRGGEAIYNDRQNIPQIVDVDCNGRLDLLMGRTSGMVTRYELDTLEAGGVPRFGFLTDRFQNIQIIGQQFPTPSMHGANTMVVVDIDRDGDQDILWGDYFEPGLIWLKNTGTCEQPVIGRDSTAFPPGTPLRTSGYNAPAVADLDGDGDLDLVVGVLGGAFRPASTSRANLYYLEQTGAMRYTLRTREFLSSIDVGQESSPALVDLDGDGDLDLVLGNKIEPDDPHTAGLYLYRNEGTPERAEFHAAGRLNIAGQYHYAPAFGDLDGDGKPDLVAGTWRDALPYYHNDGTRSDPEFVLADSALVRLTRGSFATPALVDIDGDGDLDLFVGESSGSINFYRNDGTPQTPRFTLVSDEYDGISAGRRSAPSFTDIDGDGDQDLLIGSEAGPLLLYRNLGTPTEPRFVADTTFRVALPPLSSPRFADIDGDGDPDLFAGTVSGGVVYYENTGH